ncbi:MAG: GrpB family protein [Phycisphaerae bacterium]
METLEEKVARVTAERVEVVDYDPAWVEWFRCERDHLLEVMPEGLIMNIEHFGSTAVVGLPAKPIVDMLIEVRDVQEAKTIVPRLLEPRGYDCFWRPTAGDDTPPWYTWCIKRDGTGRRTHHLHFGGVGFKNHELRFRDILRADPEIARAYGELKLRLAATHEHDRIAYTEAKGEFIRNVLGENG